MVSKKNSSSDCLPPGWKIQIKQKSGRKFKCYINLKTRQKFYSKIAVFRHIKDENVSNGEIQPSNENSKKSSGKMKMQFVEANDLQWLPTGWVLERRIRKSGAKAGTPYKCYIDPSTGSAFYSKPEVLRYLKSKQCHPGSSRQKDRRGNGHSPSKGSDDSPIVHKTNPEPKSPFTGELKVVVERTEDQDLPSGWVKESRIKVLKNKTVRRDLFYYDPDPASRLVFRSKLEALRYLETGEISKHAYRRRKGSIIGEDVAIGKTPTTSSGEGEEIPKTSTRKQLCAGESSTGQSTLAIPETGGNEKAVGKKSKRSSSRVKQAHSGSSSPKQRILSPESVSNSQDDVAKPLPEKVSGTRKTVGKTKHTAPEVLDAAANNATFNQNKPSPAHSRGILSEQNPVDAAIQGCSNRKAQASKRKAQDGMLPSVPSRSSKRLAGVDAQIMFHPIAIEHVRRATNRKSSSTKSIPSLELNPSLESGSKDGKLPSVPSRSSKRLAGVDAQIVFHPIAIEHAHRATNRKSSCTKPISSSEVTPHLESASKDGKVPSRSSKRLAGVDAQITYHPIPIEHSRVGATKKSSCIKPIPSLESVPSKLQDEHGTVHTEDWNEHACQAPRVPCLVSAPNESQVNCWNVGMQDVLVSQNEKHCTPDVNKDIIPASQGSPSNKINDLTCQVEMCHTLDFDTDNVDGSQGEPSSKFENLSEEEKHCVLEVNTLSVLATQEEPSNKFGDLTSPKDKHCTLYVDREAVVETQGEPVSVLTTEEPSNKLGDFASPEDKSCTLYVDREAVLATQGEPVSVFATQVEPLDKLGDLTSPEDALYVDREALLPTQEEQPLNKTDHLTTKNSLLVDLNFLQLEEAPPGFSGDAAVNVPSTTLNPSLEHPMDTVQGSKVENTSKAQPVIGEQLGAFQRETMQPSSELCFSSSLWSDPCLEFAYKTLTGSIPFDDNLAIQDYIQHQLRTSEEGRNNQSLPDIRASSTLRNDETKMVSTLPEELKFPNSNGYGSHEIKQVKDY